MKDISYILTIFFVYLLFAYIKTSSKKQIIPEKNGKILLKVTKLYGYIGISGILLATFLVFLMFYSDTLQLSVAGLVVWIVLFTLLYVGSVFLILHAYRYEVEINEEKIWSVSIFGKHTDILWSDITQVKFSNTTRLIFSTASTQIKIDLYVVGFPMVIELMKKKLKPELYQKAMKSLNRLGYN